MIPLNPHVLARVHVLPGTLSNASELICNTNCNDVCKRQWVVAQEGMQPCWLINTTTETPVFCIGEAACCSVNEHGECLAFLYSPVCEVSCEPHNVIHGIALAKYPWLLTGEPTFRFHRDCGLYPADCFPSKYMRPPRYFMPFSLFVVLTLSMSTLLAFVVTTCWQCRVSEIRSQIMAEERNRLRRMHNIAAVAASF
jgi:hypothetical protein